MKTFCLMLFLCLKSFAMPVTSFQEFKTAMQEGRTFAIILQAGSGLMGYFAPSSMLYIPKTETQQEHIATSHLHFSNHTGSPRYEYIKYTFYGDNSVSVQFSLYAPTSFSELPGGHAIKTVIGQGIEIQTH